MELPHIGELCVICNRNDYLPFKCSLCGKIVCVDHRNNHGNDCSLNENKFQATISDSTSTIRKKCDFCKKITLKLELSECDHCKQSHCLYHRHQVQHNCPQLDEVKQAYRLEQEQRVEKRNEALQKLKDVTASTSKALHETNKPSTVVKHTDPKKRELARRIQLMRLKQSARGPPNVLDADKIYFEIKFLHEPTSNLSDSTKGGQSIKIFTTRKHTVGRMVDWSSDELKLTNKNHIVGCSQLVFKIEDDCGNMITLDNQKCFSHYLDETKQLFSGDCINITYVNE